MKKRILIFLLIATMLVGILLQSATFEISAQTTFLATEGWYNSQLNELYINCENDMLAFAKQVSQYSNTFEGKVIHLTKDLDFRTKNDTTGDFEYYDWTNIINSEKQFSGIIDGHGHTIKGLSYTPKSGFNDHHGLLGGKIMSGETANANYKNAGAGVFDLAFVDCKMNVGDNYVGGLFGAAMVSNQPIVFENLYLDIDIVGSGKYVGGLLGYNNADLTVSNCVFNGTVTASSGVTTFGGLTAASGVTNKAEVTLSVKNSAFYGELVLEKSEDTFGDVIGVVGKSGEGYVSSANFENVIIAQNYNECKANGVLAGYCHSNSKITYNNVISAMEDSTWCGGGDGTYATSGYYSVDLDSLKGMTASVPSGFVSVPWGFAMPKGVVNFSREHAEKTPTTGASTKFVGFQTTDFAEGFCDMRLIAVTNDGKEGKSLDGFSTIGFEVEMTAVINGNEKTWKNTDNNDPKVWVVFDSIMGKSNADVTTTYTADSLGGDYIFVASVIDIKENVGDVIFTVKTFHSGNGGGRIYDDVYVINYDTNTEA